jgi:hypothetical protein
VRLKFGLAGTRGLAVIFSLGREVNFGWLRAAACGVNERQFGGDLDAAAAFGVEAGVEDVGADVLVAVADQSCIWIGRWTRIALSNVPVKLRASSWR